MVWAMAATAMVAAAAWLVVGSVSESIYSEFGEKGLPVGLLPEGITEYWVDPATGRFQVNLTEPCEAMVDPDNPLRFEVSVSGTLGVGSIGEVSGMAQQDLFLWLPVKGIHVGDDEGLVGFDVGPVHKQLPLSLFDSPLRCSPKSDDGEPRDDVVRVASWERRGEEGFRAVS